MITKTSFILYHITLPWPQLQSVLTKTSYTWDYHVCGLHAPFFIENKTVVHELDLPCPQVKGRGGGFSAESDRKSCSQLLVQLLRLALLIYPTVFDCVNNFTSKFSFVLNCVGYFTYHQVLTFNSSTGCWHCVYVFCTEVRRNCNFYLMQYQLASFFYNWGGECLLRGTYWVLV